MSAEFDAAVFKKRRDRLANEMLDGVAILPSAAVCNRNGDVDHEYRQNSDFFYLTGFEEAGSLALIIKEGDKTQFILFVPKRDKDMEIWHGRRAGPEGAKNKYLADEAFTLQEIDAKVPVYLKNQLRAYVHLGSDTTFDQRVLGWINRVRGMRRTGVNAPTELHDTAGIIHEMRLIKTEDDIKNMREAGRISAEGHCAGMRATRPGVNEYQVKAAIEFEFRNQGSPRNGYPCIVAAGDNANILHYTENNMECKNGDLILVDAGGEYGMYTADITRTWPVNGVFSEAQ
ncbi:MAG: aminopeptidase P N-terminal domain-containing protein, partial [Planctomycetota bacterium]